MIKCPKCNAENFIGAIFCRECGGKLDLNELKPADFQKMGVSSLKRFNKRLKEWVSSALTLALIALVVLISIPPSGTVARPAALETEKAELADRKLKAALNASRAMRFTFSTGDLNHLANSMYGFDPEKGKKTGHFTERHLTIGTISEKDVTITLRADLFAQIPIFTTLKVCLEKDDFLKITGAKFGRMPAIGFFKDLAVKRFKQGCQSDDAKSLFALLKAVQPTEDGGVSITVAR